MVVIGVAGEVQFARMGYSRQGELTQRIKRQLGEATERAANADLARIKLEAQLAPRSLTEQQFDVFQKLRGEVPALSLTTANDFEASRFGHEIARTLAAAGIEVKIYPPRIGLIWANTYLVFPKPPLVSAWEEPLFTAFKNAGLSTGAGWREQVPMIDLPPDIPVVMVGQKGVLYPTVPHALAVETEAEPKYVVR